jgi:hypothetical protein
VLVAFDSFGTSFVKYMDSTFKRKK